MVSLKSLLLICGVTRTALALTTTTLLPSCSTFYAKSAPGPCQTRTSTSTTSVTETIAVSTVTVTTNNIVPTTSGFIPINVSGLKRRAEIDNFPGREVSDDDLEAPLLSLNLVRRHDKGQCHAGDSGCLVPIRVECLVLGKQSLVILQGARFLMPSPPQSKSSTPIRHRHQLQW
jgi:hypothetical protein